MRLSEHHKSECPVGTGHFANENTSTSAGSIVDFVDADKRLRTEQAQAALLGHQLQCTCTDGVVSYWLSRWGYVREFASLDDVRNFLRQLGAVA